MVVVVVVVVVVVLLWFCGMAIEVLNPSLLSFSVCDFFSILG
jgi:hypothetical protein